MGGPKKGKAMKKFLGGVALAAFLAAPAMAADLPARVPVKAPAPVVFAMYNWSGFYIGAHAGYGRADVDFAFAGPPAVLGSHEASGFAGGLHTGFNWQSGRLVFGIEGALSWISGDGSSACAILTIVTCASEVDHFWRAGGRLGFAAGQTGNWLFYVTGGYARIKFETHGLTALGALVNATDRHHAGVYFGAGIEYAVGPNFILGLEAYRASFGGETVGIAPFVRNVELDVTVVQARASYKFNWGAPVQARY